MFGLIKDIEKKAKKNTYFRRVLSTGKHTQIVIMSISPKEEIGEEIHPDNDQILYLVEGNGEAVLNGKTYLFNEHDVVLVNAGTKHNFINTGDKGLKIITTYSPAHHPEGTIHKTRREAETESY